ncbi:UNKNOWN [Stylonychia lemnae]|uniref:Uncharacterized protein n=1 Tax=Stylonychia lemnae TaxID=5949 RepID=A0A078AB24_STYLE|nr:UNKNOWN [Stylonychia lemnae]|eukprot:CDW79480.1 UNKNOWN [Stylonychia lemnae]
MSEIELQLSEREWKLNLCKVKYSEYERAIQRFGYTGHIQDQSLQELQDVINFDLGKAKNRNDIYHYYYQSPYIFNKGDYKSRQLLLMGYILTSHESKKQAANAMWGLVNPEMKETVSKKELKEFLMNLCDYAVETPHQFQNFQSSDDDLELYLNELQMKKEEMIDRLVGQLDREIDELTITKKVYLHPFKSQPRLEY